MDITLEQLLESRDRRAKIQGDLLAANPGKTLLVLTVVIPGPEKRNSRSLAVAHAALQAIESEFGEGRGRIMSRDLPTGFEAYLLLDTDPADAKRRAVAIEESHPLGRLFDIDVIGPGPAPMQRSAIGASPRRCLLCGREARWCMRARSHSLPQLLTHINSLIDGYVQRT